MIVPNDVNAYWIEELGPAGWYAGGADLDQDILRRFGDQWEIAQKRGFDHWASSSEGALALLILLDQMPRNMFRGTAMAFATDQLARSVAIHAIRRRYDRDVDGLARQFFYMPFMHSESITDQERGVRLFLMHLPGGNVVHSRAHREVIRLFGRFPYRNDALGRKTTRPEADFLTKGGYSEAMRMVQS